MTHWVEQLQFQLEGKTVAIDGKTARRSHDNSTGKSALHVVSALANHVNFCLRQNSVDDKSKEIPAVKELLEILNLKGAVVTADAMYCQKAPVHGRRAHWIRWADLAVLRIDL